jgi:hypothetical protein
MIVFFGNQQLIHIESLNVECHFSFSIYPIFIYCHISFSLILYYNLLALFVITSYTTTSQNPNRPSFNVVLLWSYFSEKRQLIHIKKLTCWLFLLFLLHTPNLHALLYFLLWNFIWIILAYCIDPAINLSIPKLSLKESLH